MNIWKVLEIKETKDKDEILNAYRQKLVTVNPEEDQKGFMELRKAYEEAIKLADKTDDEDNDNEKTFPDTPVGNWMKKIVEAYNNISMRCDVNVWKELLEDEVCISLETKTEARNELLLYLMEHNYVSQEIWILFDKKFMIQDYKEELYEIFPVNYINNGVIDNILYEDYIKMDLLESRGGTEYDKYLKLCYKLYYDVNRGDVENIEDALDELNDLGIYHPYEDVIYASYLIKASELEEADRVISKLFEKYADDREVMKVKAWLCFERKEFNTAKELYGKILEFKPKYYSVLIEMGRTCFELEEYESAKEYLSMAEDIHRTSYIGDLYMRCVKELEKVYEKKHSEEPDNVNYTVEYARAIYQQGGRFDESNKLLESIEPDEENYIEYMHLLGCGYMYSENYDKAQGYLEKWMTETEKLEDDGTEKTRKAIQRLSRAYQYVANNYMCKEEYEEAEKYFNKALETGEHTIEFSEDIARLYMVQDRYDDAINACDVVLGYDSGSIMGHALRGDALKELGYYRDSLEEWEACIASDPYNLEAYIKKIELLFYLEEYDKLKETIDFLEESGVDDPLVKKWTAAVEGRTGDSNKALEMLNKLIEENIDENNILAELYFEVGRIKNNIQEKPEDALVYLNKALDIRPKYADALNYKAFILYKARRYDEAVEVYQKLIKEKPAHFNAFGILGEIYEEKRDFEKAVEYYGRQIEIAPNSYLYMSRGYCLSAMSKYAEARADYNKSIDMEPEQYNSYRHLGNTYVFEEQEEKALPYLEKALELDGGKEEMWCYMDYVSALLRLGNVEKSIEVLKDGVSNIDSQPLLLKLARVYCMAGEYELSKEIYYKNADRKVNNRLVRICELLCFMGKEREALDIMANYYNNMHKLNDDSEYTDIGDLNFIEMCIKMKWRLFPKEIIRKRDMQSAISYYLDKNMGDPVKLILLRFVADLRKSSAKNIKFNSKIMKRLLDKFSKECEDNAYCHVMCGKAAISLEKGNLKEALEYADNAVNHRKCNSCDFCKCAEGLFVKAVILEVMGKADEALECYEMAAKYDATDIFYKYEYERVKGCYENFCRFYKKQDSSDE